MAKVNLAKEILQGLPGESKFIAVPRLFIELTESLTVAMVVTQLVFRQGYKPGQWFYVTDKELAEECGISVRTLIRIREVLPDYGIEWRRFENPARMNYLVDPDAMSKAIAEKLGLKTDILDPDETDVVHDNLTPDHMTDCHVPHDNVSQLISSYQNGTTNSNTREDHKRTTKEPSRASPLSLLPKQTKTPAKPGKNPTKPNSTQEPQSMDGVSVHAPGPKAQQRDPAQRLKNAFNLTLKTLQVSERTGFTKQDDKKIKDILPLYGEDIHRLDEYAIWLSENWDAMRLTDETLKPLEAPTLNFFTSSHYFDKYFPKFVAGKRVSSGNNMNAIADARYQKEKTTLLQGTANAEFMDL